MGGWRAHTAASGAAAASMQPWRPRGKGHGLRVNAHRCVPFGHVGGQRGEEVWGGCGGEGAHKAGRTRARLSWLALFLHLGHGIVTALAYGLGVGVGEDRPP